jgi:methyl-accepting chemotaxis protein
MFKSIQSRLVFIVSVIVIVSLSLLGFLIYRTSSHAVEYRVKKETMNLSSQVSQQISKSIETNTHNLLSLSKMIQIATNVDDALAEQHPVFSEFTHIFVVDNDGKLTNLSPSDYKLIGMDLSKTDYVAFVREHKKRFVSEPRTFFDYQGIVIAVPIFFNLGSEKQEFFGVMCGTLKLDTLFGPVTNFHLEQSGYAMVLDQNGLILGHPNPQIAFQKKITEIEENNPSLTELWHAITGKKQGVPEYRYQGENHIAGYIQTDVNNWTVLVTIPLKEVLTDVEKLKIRALALTLVFLGLAIFFVFITARSISRPIVSMTQEVEAFVGSTIQDIKTHKKDEVSILAVSLKALMDYLREMASLATHISRGDLSLQIEPKSQQDILGHAFSQMTQYFKDMAQVANNLANGDLIQDIHPQSEKDVLGSAFKNMLTQLRSLVSQIQRNADQIAAVSEQVSVRSDEDLKTVENIISSAEETSSAMTQMEASVEEVAEGAQTLFSATEEISSSIEEMFNSMRQVTHNAEELSELAEANAAAMNQMALSMEKVAKNAGNSKRFYEETTDIALQGQISVQQVITSMDKIRRIVLSATQTIQNLETKSQEISSIVEVIDGIADQTALLALNAAILAAQVGEHGKGFAVVADEIKGLANRVVLSTKEITQIIESVQRQSADAVRVIQEGNREVDEGVQVAHQAGQSLDHITQSARNSLSAASEIAQAIVEQKESTRMMMGSVEKVTERILEINRATQEQERGSSQILSAARGVRELAEHVKRATSEQMRGTSQVSIAMEEVKSHILHSRNNAELSAQAAQKLSSQAIALRRLMNQFKLNKG